MKRFVATARGRVQRVGYREHVYNETFERNISGYVKNLDTGEVEIVAEGREEDLREFINAINIVQRPIAVKSFTVRWEEATGEYATFEIIRGDIQEGIFEWLCYAGKVLHSMDMKLDQNLQVSKESLQVSKEIKEEIVGLRSDPKKHLDDEFAEIRKELVSIKDALARAGIQV
ncbi:Acylphosphatase [anaerobic digester metagenome]